MPYDNILSRADAQAFIPDEVVSAVIKSAANESAALQLFRRVSMGTKIGSLPVLSAMAQAYFVNGDTGLKQTTEMAWRNILLEAEEIAAIVPVPEAVVEDASIDLWGEIQDGLAEAIGIALDAAVFAGTGKPATWSQAIIPAAIAASNTHVSDSPVDEGGIANDLALTFDYVENDGYDVTAIAGVRSLRSLLRRARDTNGQRLVDTQTGAGLDAPLVYVNNGVFSPNALAVVGDFNLAVIGIRSDMTYKILDQAVIMDNTGAVIYNLAQQDMLALRVTFRAGFAVANPVTRPVTGTGSGTPYPFAVLQPPAAP